MPAGGRRSVLLHFEISRHGKLTYCLDWMICAFWHSKNNGITAGDQRKNSDPSAHQSGIGDKKQHTDNHTTILDIR